MCSLRRMQGFFVGMFFFRVRDAQKYESSFDYGLLKSCKRTQCRTPMKKTHKVLVSRSPFGVRGASLKRPTKTSPAFTPECPDVVIAGSTTPQTAPRLSSSFLTCVERCKNNKRETAPGDANTAEFAPEPAMVAGDAASVPAVYPGCPPSPPPRQVLLSVQGRRQVPRWLRPAVWPSLAVGSRRRLRLGR